MQEDMNENEHLKARLLATNQMVMELVEKDVNNRITIAGLRGTVALLQEQLAGMAPAPEPANSEG